jgi:hypothetical protein
MGWGGDLMRRSNPLKTMTEEDKGGGLWWPPVEPILLLPFCPQASVPAEVFSSSAGMEVTLAVWAPPSG